MMTKSAPGVRLSTLVIACLFFVMLATTGSQCSRVEDPAKTSGVDVLAAAAGCLQDCNNVARAARDAEMALHAINVAACQALPPSSRGPCLVAEDARHDARMDQIATDQAACKAGCHNQGGLAAGE